MKRKKEKKPAKTADNTMDRYLKAILVTLLAFTITMIAVYCLTGGVPDTLITCVFAAMTGECGFMAVIKSMKVKHEDKKEEAPEAKEEPEPVENDGDGVG